MGLGIGGETGPAGAASQSKGARDALAAGPGRGGRGQGGRGLGKPTNAPYAGMPPKQFRRTVNPTTTRPLTARNLLEAAGMMPVGPMSAVSAMLGALGVPGLAPKFEGPEGIANGIGDYDPTNRAGTGLLMRMNQRAGRGLQRGY